MKTMYTYISKLVAAVLFSALLFISCERSIDGLSEPTRNQNPEVFIDGFSAGLEYYPFGDSKFTAFSVDTRNAFGDRGSSMRFDIPNVGDPAGPYAGAIFKDENGGRDLSQYNALTFYAKATKAATINEIGFGQDFEGNTYQTTINNLRIGTGWQKYIIPIPDPSRLTEEAGMFWYSEGPEDGDGYTFWVDELKYEFISTLAQPRPFINGGQEATNTVFNGQILDIPNLGSTFNVVIPLTDDISVAQDITVAASRNYFNFSSSNTSVAALNESGAIEVVGEGTAQISATLGGVPATGSITLESLGEFSPAPTPTRSADDVISIFSDAYQNVPISYFNGRFDGDGQTTRGGEGRDPSFIVDGNSVINYTSLNFVAMGFFPGAPDFPVDPINASEMTHINLDIYVNESIQPGDFIRLQLHNSVGNNEINGRFTINASSLVENGWASFDIPLSSFVGLNNRSQLGLLFFISDATISDIYVDNVYFYRQ